MQQKLKPITEKELRIQEAIGSLPEEYRNGLCRHKTPEVSKGTRTCSLCGLKCIHKGEEFYLIDLGGDHWDGVSINICKTCYRFPSIYIRHIAIVNCLCNW